MSDVVIILRGGVYQGAVSDSPGNRIMVIDYDDELAAGHPQRTFERIPADQRTFARVIKEGNGIGQATRQQ